MDEPQHGRDDRARSPAAPDPQPGELAESRLRRSGYSALQNLSCDFRAGVLTLRGCLPTYYLKQVALALIATVEGVQQIEDRVEVKRQKEPYSERPPFQMRLIADESPGEHQDHSGHESSYPHQ
jgi:hypothetical protein